MQTSPISVPASQSVTSAATTASSGAAASATVDFQNFLRLLTAQLRYQDPLAPLDATQFVSQLASFSTVEQLVSANDRLKAIEGAIAPQDLSQYAGWIGRVVETADAPVSFDGAPIAFRLPPSAGAAAIDVVLRDTAGREVARTPASASTQVQFWTPGVAPGLYRLEAVATAADGATTTAPATIFAAVASARLGPTGPVLGLGGGLEIEVDAATAIHDRAPTPGG
jgi:flagellar basal-body rod modification protein FlgD